MKFLMICVALLVMALANPSLAGDRKPLGWGYVITNDVFGDTNDRWRTGALAVSHLRAKAWTGRLPSTFGDLVELRFRGEVIAPERLNAPSPADRRYVGALSFGAHSHWQSRGAELSIGLDLVFVGDQTNLDGFQAELHDLFGGPRPNVSNFQVADAVYPTLTFEAGKKLFWGPSASMRPFVEMQAGVETLMRVGVDLTFGTYGEGGVLLRDVSSGQRYLGTIVGQKPGLSFLVGGDIAYVADSQYLATPGVVAKDFRARARVGYHRGWKRGGIFYGATYLSKEFEAQREGQLLGAVSIRYKF